MDTIITIQICQTVIYICTLLVLIWQIYELRKSIQTSSFLTVGQNYIPTMLEVVKNPELGKCFKFIENSNLSHNEIAKKFYIHVLICNFVNAYINWKYGYYTEDTWNAWKRWFKEWVAGNKFREEWNSTKNVFSDEFVKFVDELLEDDNLKG